MNCKDTALVVVDPQWFAQVGGISFICSLFVCLLVDWFVCLCFCLFVRFACFVLSERSQFQRISSFLFVCQAMNVVVQPAVGYFKGLKTDNGITEKSSLSLALSSCSALGLKQLGLPIRSTVSTATPSSSSSSSSSSSATFFRPFDVMDMLFSMLQTTQVRVVAFLCCI